MTRAHKTRGPEHHWRWQQRQQNKQIAPAHTPAGKTAGTPQSAAALPPPPPAPRAQPPAPPPPAPHRRPTERPYAPKKRRTSDLPPLPTPDRCPPPHPPARRHSSPRPRRRPHPPPRDRRTCAYLELRSGRWAGVRAHRHAHRHTHAVFQSSDTRPRGTGSVGDSIGEGTHVALVLPGGGAGTAGR